MNSGDGGSSLQARMREIHLELRNLVLVKHPFVVTFWGTALEFPDDGPAYLGLVFELCERGSVHAAIFGDSAGTRLNLGITWKVRIAHQVAAGLAYLHGRRIIHRDINSKNILLTNDMTAKIGDYGAARSLPPTSDFLPTTTILGSPAYMAPEQMQGHPLTVKTDVWAFALLLWEMMCERKPWDGVHSDYEVLRAATLRGDRLPLPDDLRGWPAEYVAAIRDGNSLEPAERPQMEQARRSLRAAVENPAFGA